jgi:DNA-binding response OmpR family regulator
MKLILIEDEKELANSIQSYLTGNYFVRELAVNEKKAINKIST